jgi:hypothetical protein
MISRFDDDRHKLKTQKMTTDLDERVLVYNHSGIVRSETMEQVAFVPWFDLNWPEYRLSLFHVPNETQGKKDKFNQMTGGAKKHQQQLNSMGRRAGCSDLILGLPSKHWPYVAIEFKAKKGYLDDDQYKFLNHHARLGALCAVVRGNEAARRFIKEYLQYV